MSNNSSHRMLEHLFGSKTRLKILRTFFRDPAKPYFIRELTRVLDAQINAIRRELAILEKVGLVSAEERREKNEGGIIKKYYTLNTASLLYPELHALLLKAQVLGEQAFIQEITERAGNIHLFLLTGRFTNTQVPSDILLVGEFKERAVLNIIAHYEKEFGFEIRYTLMTPKEFQDRRDMMDKFLYGLFEANHLKVVNKVGV